MPSSTQPNLGLDQGWSPGEDGWGGAMNYNLRALDALVQASVIDTLDTPPGSPSVGDMYEIGDAPTGDWTGQGTRLARWSGSAWEFYVPKDGWRIYHVAEGAYRRYLSGAWEPDESVAVVGDTLVKRNATGQGEFADPSANSHAVTLNYAENNYEKKRQNNLNATADPTATDDSSAGYQVLSKWVNTTSKEIFVCLDATAGAAEWGKTTLTLDELGSGALVDVGTASGQIPLNSDLADVAFSGKSFDVEYEPGKTVEQALDEALAGGGGSTTDPEPLEGLGINTKPVSVKPFGSLQTMNFKFRAGSLAGDGKIYCAPCEYSEILVIDPVTDTIETFGTFSSNFSYFSSVTALNGKVYGIPGIAGDIMEIDPVTRTTTTFGTFTPVSNGWTGAVLAPNGFIYAIPADATEVIKIDPDNKTTTTFGSIPAGDKYWGGVLAEDGKIYCIPYAGNEVLVIDPNNDTLETFGDISAITVSTSKWAGGALAPNGLIYCAPTGSQNQVLIIDPVGRTLGSITGVTSTGYQGAVLAPNGRIYCIPGGSLNILEIDPETDTLRYAPLPSNAGGSDSWFGGVLAPNGAIYGTPSHEEAVLKITPYPGGSSWWPLSRHVNTF